MSSAAPVKPIFEDEETRYLKPVDGPFSKLAVAALLLGIVSFPAAYSPTMLLIPILAIALGAAAVWQIARTDALGGRSAAVLAIGLGLMFTAWSLTAAKMREHRLFTAGAEFAGHVLTLIADDDRFVVYELTLPEAQRQTPNVSLKEHYESLIGEQKDLYESFFREPGVRDVMSRGSKADWRFAGGVRISNLNKYETEIVVAMEDAAQTPKKLVNVRLVRHLSPDFDGAKPTANWSLIGIKS